MHTDFYFNLCRTEAVALQAKEGRLQMNKK